MSGNARHRSNVPRGRAFAIFSLLVGAAAIVIAVAAFTVASPASDVVLEVEVETATLATTASSVPETAAPAPSTTSTVPPTAPSTAPSTGPSTTITTSTTLPPEVPPTAVVIDDLGISQGVLPVGLEDDGSMEVPDISDIGWYLHGATPGHPGATVLVAHVWWHKTAGPFHRLGALEPGARIEVDGEDGTIHEYTVTKRTMYDKDKLPGDLWRKSGPETLVLITCGGTLNQATRRYEQNIVVYAVPTREVTDRPETI
jgi:hypothetical protein